MPALRQLPALLALAACSLPAQVLFDASPGSPLRFHPSDLAVLAGDRDRDDLACSVEPLDPHLDFDLKFTAGYVVRVPASTIISSGDSLRILFRVRPAGAAGAPDVYFQQSFAIPDVSSQDGIAAFPGRFVLGPGLYEIDWLMRNRAGRVCSAHWTADADLPARSAQLAAAAPPHLIRPHRAGTFADEPPVARAAAAPGGLHVALLLNLAPRDRARFKLDDHETASLVAMLRTLHREPSLGLFSLTAFNAYDRRVVYSVERQPRLDFAALGAAIDSMPVGLVGVDELADSEGDQAFLSDLLNQAFAAGREPPDATLIIGPKVDRESAISPELLQVGARAGPMFQFAFDRNPRSYPWPGAIEAALRPHGLVPSAIITPRDFTRALVSFLDAIGAAPDAARAEVAGPATN